jgi:hypothetical protein
MLIVTLMNVVILSVVMLNVVITKCDQNHSYDCFELCHTVGLNKLTPEIGLLNKFSCLAAPISMTKFV